MPPPPSPAPPTVPARHWPTSAPEQDPPAAGRQCLAVGTDRERSIDMLIDPKTDLESIATINSVVLLLATFHELERGRAEREERATLWPVDELPADADGAVTVVTCGTS